MSAKNERMLSINYAHMSCQSISLTFYTRSQRASMFYVIKVTNSRMTDNFGNYNSYLILSSFIDAIFSTFSDGQNAFPSANRNFSEWDIEVQLSCEI